MLCSCKNIWSSFVAPLSFILQKVNDKDSEVLQSNGAAWPFQVFTVKPFNQRSLGNSFHSVCVWLQLWGLKDLPFIRDSAQHSDAPLTMCASVRRSLVSVLFFCHALWASTLLTFRIMIQWQPRSLMGCTQFVSVRCLLMSPSADEVWSYLLVRWPPTSLFCLSVSPPAGPHRRIYLNDWKRKPLTRGRLSKSTKKKNLNILCNQRDRNNLVSMRI